MTRIRWENATSGPKLLDMKLSHAILLAPVFGLLGHARAAGAAEADGTPPRVPSVRDGEPRPGTTAPEPYALRPSAMLGLSQWIVFGGGNVATQVKFGRFVLEYSHGQALDFTRIESVALTQEEREAGVSVGMPWTTGGGFGVQLTPNFHALVELKAHRYQIRSGFDGRTLDYTSFTVGPGLFYDIYLYEGLFIQPNLRWWPTVGSTYDGGELRAEDGSSYRHERHDLLPFLNVNLGWTFSGK